MGSMSGKRDGSSRPIERRVAQGDLLPGEQFPTVRELATDWRIHFNSVGRAYRLLDKTGMSSTQRGSGVYICKAPTEKAAPALRQEGLAELPRRFIRDALRFGYTRAEMDCASGACKQRERTIPTAGRLRCPS